MKPVLVPRRARGRCSDRLRFTLITHVKRATSRREPCVNRLVDWAIWAPTLCPPNATDDDDSARYNAASVVTSFVVGGWCLTLFFVDAASPPGAAAGLLLARGQRYMRGIHAEVVPQRRYETMREIYLRRLRRQREPVRVAGGMRKGVPSA